MNKKYKDTDLREALRRKYADTPKLPEGWPIPTPPPTPPEGGEFRIENRRPKGKSKPPLGERLRVGELARELEIDGRRESQWLWRGSKICLLDFCFNGWGEKFEARLDNAINAKLFSMLPCHGNTPAYENHLDFVLEGGSIESDGEGSIFTTRCCLLAPHRNQPLSEAEIETELKRRLCASRIVWLDGEPMPGDDTDGHIDTIVRTAPGHTLLYNRNHKMKVQLQELRTLGGQPYRLLELPLPSPIYDEDGEQLPATYANFLILNGAVLVPTYNQPENDNEALRIIQSAFPEHEMVPIDSRSIIKQHGSIHCCTMQFFE